MNPTNYSVVKLDSPFSSYYYYDFVYLKQKMSFYGLYIVEEDLTKKLIVYACLKLLACFKAAQVLLFN